MGSTIQDMEVMRGIERSRWRTREKRTSGVITEHAKRKNTTRTHVLTSFTQK